MNDDRLARIETLLTRIAKDQQMIGIKLGLALGGNATGESTPQINITAEPVIAQSDTNPQGTATVSSGTTSDSTGFAIVSSEWVHSVLGDVQSNTSPYTKPAGAAYTLRLKQVVSATDLPNKTVYSNTLMVDALSITAVIAPAIGSLSHNNTIDGVTNWEEFDDPLNYASNGGSISTVVPTFTGTFGGDETTTLSAGDTAGFTITVTDSNSNEETFVVSPVTVAATVAGAPTGLSATPGDGEVDLSWTAPSNNGGQALTDYVIQVNIDGAGFNTISDGVGTGTTYTHTGLTNGDVHQYQVKALNGIGSGGNYSSIASTTPTATAEILSLEVTGPQSGGDLPISYLVSATTDIAWGYGTGSTPSATDLRAGTGMTDFGTASLPYAGGPTTVALASDIDATGLNFWAVPDGSSTVTTATGDDVPFAIDTKAPAGTLSGTQTGPTTATIGLNLTDEAGDVGDIAVYPTASTPTQGEIEAGTGATWSVQDVSLTAGDTNDQSATGLTASTAYKAHAVVTDAQGNKTTLTPSAEFTTAAAATAFTDDFNRANELLNVSTDWVDIRDGGMSVDTNLVRGNGNNQQGALYTGSVGANQYTQLEFKQFGNSWVLILRATDGDNFYGARFRDNDTYIYELVAGSETKISGPADAVTTYTDGDILYFEVDGTTLTAKVNGVTKATCDTSAGSAGYTTGDIGFMSRGSGANRADNFEGGDL